MSKFIRMVDVLDLFSETVTVLTAEEIADRLQLSRPTAFRYVKELTSAGFLANYAGQYSLGARIITLDHRIRQSDPLLQLAKDVMKQLALETASTSILCRMYNEEVINVHHEVGYDETGVVTFGRGRPLPLFHGSASKIMLAYMPGPRLKKIYTKYRERPEVRALGKDWSTFKSHFDQVRQQGYYVSEQEVDKDVVGIAAPILVQGLGCVAVISLVFSLRRFALINGQGVAGMLKLRNAEIAKRLHALTAPAVS